MALALPGQPVRQRGREPQPVGALDQQHRTGVTDRLVEEVVTVEKRGDRNGVQQRYDSSHKASTLRRSPRAYLGCRRSGSTGHSTLSTRLGRSLGPDAHRVSRDEAGTAKRAARKACPEAAERRPLVRRLERHVTTGARRQWIESTFWTCKGQLGLERHGARTLTGLGARIGLRLLARAAEFTLAERRCADDG
jgi:hypothetical protein